MANNQSLGEFDEAVLSMVAGLHGKAYGVSILESLKATPAKKPRISTIHLALKRLEDKGFVKSYFGAITANRGGRRKKLYIITAFGKRVLEEQYELSTNHYQQVPKIAFTR
jgi:PadR family transcriptional regulator, regulatory protein PadR